MELVRPSSKPVAT